MGYVVLVMFVAMFVNAPLRAVTTVGRAAIRATDIRAAMRPYSMAVAPDSSLAKRATSFDISYPRMRRGVPRWRVCKSRTV